MTMNLEQLPEDILIPIFTQFFFHCQHPGHFPNAEILEVRDNKKTLACLSKTSKALCAVAQPIIYHFYAKENMGKVTKVYQDNDGVERPPVEHDFLRTL